MAIVLIFLLLALVFLLFVTEVVPADLVALGAMVVVALAGWVSPGEALSAFANEAPVTVAAMFIVSAGLQRCGLIEDVGRVLRRFSTVTELRLLFLLMITVSLCSAFINNTPVVVAFLPLVLGVARHYDISASKLLIPLSYSAIFGGTCTLIGTSTNLVVSSLASSRYHISIGMFEITGVGLAVMVTGIAYMLLIGRHLLPRRESLASLVNAIAARDYVMELEITADSPFRGRKLSETELNKISNVRVQQIIRNEEEVDVPLNDVVLEANDRLVLGGPRVAMVEVEALRGVALAGEGLPAARHAGTKEMVVLEGVVTNNSRFSARTLEESRLRENCSAQVLAIHRQGENITRNVGQVALKFGDTLLLRISDEGVARLRGSRDLLLLTDTAAAAARRDKRPIVLGVLGAVVVLATLGIYPISLLALTGVVVFVATRCLRMSEVYDSIDWRIVSIIVGMIALGTAMENTGAAQWVVREFIGLFGGANPALILAAFYFLSMIMTELISNNAVAILMTPIAVRTAESLDLNPLPFLIAIMFAASASFSTPIGYQTNTFVYGAGGYKFSDFLRVGIPLNVLLFLEVTFLIPRIWPLR